MTMAIRHRPRGLSSATPREVTILQLLDWAFQKEKIRIDFDQGANERPQGALKGYGMEHILMRQAELGCRVQGGGTSEPHPDADAVADALAQLPEGVGGRRMALVIADLCRAGETLGWGSDLAPQVQPIDWKQTKHGRFAVTETCGKARYTSRGKVREVDLRCCPITIENHPRDQARARRDYLLWWSALKELRDTFRIYGGLTAHQVTEALPPMKPWEGERARRAA
mgnify:CR=1 FL=1